MASKYALLGGFDGTSNLYSSYLCGTPAIGTTAHSMIMSYEKESDIEHQRHLSSADGSRKDVDFLHLCEKYR